MMQYYNNSITWSKLRDDLIEDKIYYVGKSYKTNFSFYNSEDEFPISLSFDKQGSDQAFVFTTTCPSPQLAPNANCALTISFTPKSIGKKNLHLIVNVSDYEIPEARKVFAVAVEEPVSIDAELIKDLAAEIEVGKPYPVSFQFSVTGKRSATGVLVKINETFAKNFQLHDDIKVTTIHSDQPLVVKGIFTPTQAGANQQVGVILTYTEGPTILLGSSLTNVKEKLMVSVVGRVTENFNQLIKVGLRQALKFTFSNETAAPATDIQITIK